MNGVYEITPDSGSAFFLRTEYLTYVGEDKLQPVKGGLGETDSLFAQDEALEKGMQGVLTDEEAADLLNAALVFSAERVAMSYLARAEHCRFMLKQKLLRKGIDKNSIKKSLDFLETTGALDDVRFAGAWLRSRYIAHAEGRRKLEGELLKRGLSKDVAKIALDDFFSSHSESELCKRAYKKCLRIQKDPSKIYSSLQRLGFSGQQIKKVLNQ